MDLRISITNEDCEELEYVVVYQDGSDSEGARKIVNFITDNFQIDEELSA